MKKIILMTCLFSSSVAMAMPPLMCSRFTGTGVRERNGSSSLDSDDWDLHYKKINSKDIGFKGDFSTKCVIPGNYNGSNDNYIVYVRGFGLGASIGAGNAVMLNCPLVKRSRITRDYFYGIDVHASVGIGGHVGVFANKRLGICFLTGLDLGGIGAAIKGVRVAVEENYRW